MDYYKKVSKTTGQERCFRPTLLQTLHATISSETFKMGIYEEPRYIEPGRAIVLNHPITLNPDDAAFFLQEQGYLFYGGDYFYQRCVDGQLIEQGNNISTDCAAEANLDLLSRYQKQWPIMDIMCVDLDERFYYLSPLNHHDIFVCSSQGRVKGKFHLLGVPSFWYLTLEGQVCTLTSNGASDPGKKKNLLRLYRLDLPNEVELLP